MRSRAGYARTLTRIDRAAFRRAVTAVRARLAPPIVPQSVSALIPTLNAGPDFAATLAALRAQQGLAVLEIIVADSGSSDDTVRIAEQHGARVLEVPHGSFNHGRTRDWMAEHARSDILLLTVQDALLPRPDAVSRLASELGRDPRRAAVSARQRPRPDSDLYGRFWIWNHNRGTRAARRANPSAVFPDVDDVCAAIRRAAWEEVRFREVPYAEDLDFGRRAAERGWTLHLSDDVEVVHSHRRSPLDHLCRNVADRLYGAPLVDDTRVSEAARDGVLPAAAAVVSVADAVDAALLSHATDEVVDLAEYVAAIAAGVESRAGGRATQRGPLGEVKAFLEGSGASQPRVAGAATTELLTLLRSDAVREFADEQGRAPAAEARAFVANVAAALLGRVLGDALRAAPDDSPLAARLVAASSSG